MPNFHVHWLVALEAVSAAPQDVSLGLDAYSQESRKFRDALLSTFRGIRGQSDLATARAGIQKARNTWVNRVLDTKDGTRRDQMTCFAAYALGACGPDFWTLPAKSTGLAPSFASEHFDLGHYNRTHVQFERSVEEAGKKKDLQARVEQAYFHGMATHFAADLVVHQLVNVSAGAYNLQRKPWRNEQARGKPFWQNFLTEIALKGTAALLIPGWPYPPNWRPFLDDNAGNTLGLWSTHNKVEHYWDTYVRHRYLGDVGPVFGGADARNWNGFEPLGLPTCEGLWRQLGKELGRTPPEGVANLLREPLVTWAVEKPLTLPWLFCERVRNGELRPFIYDRVVDPKRGAYPTAVVSKAVNEEKTHPQMTPDPTASKSLVRPSEARRLAFFSSELNDTDSTPASWNYLTYFVCPDFTKVALHGKDVFYHLDALGPFVAAASAVAGRFMAQLAGAYTGGTLQGMRDLRRFWNLDTGLGLRVQSVATDTAKDVVTRIDLVHVFDVLGHSVEYLREVPWMPRLQAAIYGFPEGRAFRFRANQQEFESLAELSEPDEEAYLECIRLTDEARASQLFPALVGEDEFWQARTAGHSCVVQVPSSQLTSGQPMKITLLDIAHRLTLQFRASIADLGRATSGDDRTAHEELSFFAMSDKAQGIKDACTDTVHDWAKKHWVKEKGVVLDFAETPEEVRNGLQLFSTRVLLGFDTDPELKRVTALGTWNNVVAKHEVGRNLAVATGRRLVLHPTVAPSEIPTQGGKSTGEPFDPERQYEYYSDPSPTEQVFFTVYPLVTTRDGIWDVFAKKKVEEKQFEQLKAIDSVGFVKIVLMYALTGRGALQLDRCWIDGVPVTVERAARAPV